MRAISTVSVVDLYGIAALCQCKRTGNQPYCDGSHARLPAEG